LDELPHQVTHEVRDGSSQIGPVLLCDQPCAVSHMNLSGKLGQLCIAHLVLGCLPETIKVWPHAVVEATPSGRPVSVVLAQEAAHQTHHH